jgi:hypothetical protein
MKVYYVWSESWDYDEFDSFVVVAETAERAVDLVKDNFTENQGKLYAEEVKLKEEEVVLGSFNAG